MASACHQFWFSVSIRALAWRAMPKAHGNAVGGVVSIRALAWRAIGVYEAPTPPPDVSIRALAWRAIPWRTAWEIWAEKFQSAPSRGGR